MDGGTLYAQDCAITGNTASFYVSVPQNLKPPKSARFFMLSVIQTFSHLLPWPQWSVMKLLNASSPLQGGGMYIVGSSTVTVTTCTISGNTANYVSHFPKNLEPLCNSPSPQWISFHVFQKRALTVSGRWSLDGWRDSACPGLQHHRQHCSLCEHSAKFETSQKCSLFFHACDPNLL
jgi:hypothetical protein